VVLLLGAALAAGLPAPAFRYAFWIGLAAIAGALVREGLAIGHVAIAVGVMALLCLLGKGGRATLLLCRDSLAESAKIALPVGLACVIVGAIIGMMTQTGVGTVFGSWVIGLGKSSLFLALILTMILSILLGTGIPTIPTYIIVAALAAPALEQLGVPLIVSHMFAFYFGIMADLSPPVALAALAAAPIARENPDKIGWEAMRVALAGYVIPFMAVYAPALMLQNGDPMAAYLGFWGAVAYATFKACVAIGLFGIAAIGFLFSRLSVVERVLSLGAAVLLLGEVPYSDLTGYVLAAVLVAWQWNRAHRKVLA